MQRSLLWRFACLAFIAFAVSGAAHADIKAFNAAVKASDYKTAAAQAEDIWKTWDTTDEQTAVLAREFGFAALVAGRNDLAHRFGEFLVQKGATLKTPDDQPVISAVLYRVADFKLKKGDAERAALRSALVARNGVAGVDMTSVLSWEALYVADWNAGDWEGLIADGTAAAEYFKRQPGPLLNRQRDAEVFAASGKFLSGHNRLTKGRNDFYVGMADLHDAIVGDINAAASASMRKELYEAKWKAEAWALAIESYLASTYAQTGSLISSALQTRELLKPVNPPYAEDATNAQMPMCEGKFEGRKLVYPGNKQFKGLVAGVIAHMETDATGKVTKAEVLAAVPTEGFSDYVVETAKTWTFKPAAGVDTSACGLNSRNRVFRVMFTIG